MTHPIGQDTPAEESIVEILREFAGNNGYSHNDYADPMRQAAKHIEQLELKFAGVELMFMAACDELAAINEHLGIDQSVGDAAMIIARIEQLERQLADSKDEVAGLKAARWAYASEFALTVDDCPDVGSIHQNIRALKKELAEAKQDAIPAELLLIGELLRTQNNQYTDQPMFVVQQKRLIVGLDADYSQGDEDIVWSIDDCQYFAGEPEFEEMERGYQENSEVPDDWHRTSFTTQWEYVTACFTEQGCKDYLKLDGHNLKEPRIYAEGSYRNEEYRTLRNWLKSLPAPAMQAKEPT